MKREEFVNVFLVLGIFISFAFLLLTWVIFEPLLHDPSYDDWIQFSVIGVMFSGQIIPMLVAMIFVAGTIVNVWYPLGAGIQIAGLVIFGIAAPELVSDESISHMMNFGLGYVVAWFGTILTLISTLPFLRGVTIDQSRGIEPVGRHVDYESHDVWRLFSTLGMRRKW